jgi:hypothetical protein
MKGVRIVAIMLLISSLYTIFVWWFFTENSEYITNGKVIKCGPRVDTINNYQPKDTLKGFRPIDEHSQLP